MMEIAENHISLIGDVNRLGVNKGEWEALKDAFDEFYRAGLVGQRFQPFPAIAGGATPLTSLRTRWDREAVTSGTAESHEVDFNIAFGQAIEISGVVCRIQQGP